MDFSQYIPIISAGATLSLVVLLAIKEWRSGSGKISAEVITNYKNLDDQQKAIIEEYKISLATATTTIQQMDMRFAEKVAKFEGIILAKDKQIEDLSKILSNRNPELEKVLSDIRNFMQQIIQTNLAQTKMLEGQQKRNQAIGKASKNKTGQPMRSPSGSEN